MGHAPQLICQSERRSKCSTLPMSHHTTELWDSQVNKSKQTKYGWIAQRCASAGPRSGVGWMRVLSGPPTVPGFNCGGNSTLMRCREGQGLRLLRDAQQSKDIDIALPAQVIQDLHNFLICFDAGICTDSEKWISFVTPIGGAR